MKQGKTSDLDILLERSRQLSRFQDLKRDVILPTLRTLMADLDRKGHLTRIWEKTSERIRFDIQIQTRVPKQGAMELSLHARELKLKIDYGWNSGAREQELHPLEAVKAAFITDRILHLLQGLA
ncbi:MAG TPA: hypothetical protein VIE43_08150 [Thermoanaerobaculia bacterium]|nr:hypothetical protein [Thermoanaerobaculia bacterium]